MEKEEYTSTITSALGTGRCFMAKDGLSISAYFFASDKMIVVLYQPLTKSLEAGIIAIRAINNADLLMKTLQEGGEINSYYEVDNGDIVTMAQLVLEFAR